MAKKVDPPTITPTPALDLHHPDLAAFVKTITDPDLDRLAADYRRAADEAVTITRRYDVAQRRLDGLTLALEEAPDQELDGLLTQRALASGEAVSLSVAVAGARRRHTAARFAWLERLRDLATAETKAAFAAVDAVNAQSRPDRRTFLKADGDSRIELTDDQRASLRERLAESGEQARPLLARAEQAKMAAGIAQYHLDQITERERRAA